MASPNDSIQVMGETTEEVSLPQAADKAKLILSYFGLVLMLQVMIAGSCGMYIADKWKLTAFAIAFLIVATVVLTF
jgi:hypothetical protein